MQSAGPRRALLLASIFRLRLPNHKDAETTEVDFSVCSVSTVVHSCDELLKAL